MEKHNFFPGSDWSENVAGTNAIGTALLEKAPTGFLKRTFLSGLAPMGEYFRTHP